MEASALKRTLANLNILLALGISEIGAVIYRYA